MSGFDVGDGFGGSAADVVAAAPEAMAAVTATGLSAADLGMYPNHIFMKIIE